MKRVLRWMALIVAGVGLTLWALAGMHRGWTQTSVPVKTVDEVTGLEGVSYERRFVPGLDFLGVTAITSAVLAGLTLLQRGGTKLQTSHME